MRAFFYTTKKILTFGLSADLNIIHVNYPTNYPYIPHSMDGGSHQARHFFTHTRYTSQRFETVKDKN